MIYNKELRRFFIGLSRLFFGYGSAAAADQALIDAAKKEGEVVWYTTQIVDQIARPIADAFQTRYGIKASLVRADSNDVALRIANEGKAGHPQGDVIDGQSAAATLERQGLLLQWAPDAATRLPQQYVDARGYWTATNVLVIEPGFNTSLVPKGTEPKDLERSPRPEMERQNGLERQSGRFDGTRFRRSGSSRMGRGKGHGVFAAARCAEHRRAEVGRTRCLLDQVIAGEYAIGLQLGNNQVAFESRRGAPIGWIAMQPALVIMSAVSVVKGSPHPNAAKLLVDFILSDESQKLFRDADYIPVDPAVDPRDPASRPDGVKFRAVYMTPEELDGSMGQWKKIFDDLFR